MVWYFAIEKYLSSIDYGATYLACQYNSLIRLFRTEIKVGKESSLLGFGSVRVLSLQEFGW